MIKIHKVVEGPLTVDDISAEFVPPELYSSKTASLVDVLIEDECGVYPIKGSLWFYKFDDAYKFKNHFRTRIDPIIINDENEMVYETGEKVIYGDIYTG